MLTQSAAATNPPAMATAARACPRRPNASAATGSTIRTVTAWESARTVSTTNATAASAPRTWTAVQRTETASISPATTPWRYRAADAFEYPNGSTPASACGDCASNPKAPTATITAAGTIQRAADPTIHAQASAMATPAINTATSRGRASGRPELETYVHPAAAANSAKPTAAVSAVARRSRSAVAIHAAPHSFGLGTG